MSTHEPARPVRRGRAKPALDSSGNLAAPRASRARPGATAVVVEDVTLSRHRTRRRTMLLEHALRMLEDGWYPSIPELAAAAGVARATAYRYFPTQGALTEAIIDESLRPVLSFNRPSGPPDQAVRALLKLAYPQMTRREGALRAALESSLRDWANARAKGEPQRTPRPSRRRAALDHALGPMADVGAARRERLLDALSLIYGTEAMIVLRDLCGLSERGMIQLTGWISDALIDATLRESHKPVKDEA